MDHREFNQLIELMKSINGNLKRIGDELVILQMHTAYQPNKLNETDQKEEE